MKRKGNLYEQIISLDNLRLADKKARKGKKWQYGVINHSKNRENNILKLYEILRNKEFKTSRYSIFTIFDKKEREIFSLPYYPDRIVHHAILNIISSIFLNCFISTTYSCIPNKGIHKCLIDVKKSLKDETNTLYCLKLDIKKYYPSINKSILKKFLRKKFKDRDLLTLLDSIIDSNENGLPIGNYLSQFFANFYLTYFDHYLKEQKKVKYYFRYMDDVVILHNSKEYLHKLKIDIETYLFNVLDLELSNWQVFPVKSRGIDFVGYKIFHTHVLLRKSIKNNFIKMIKYNKNTKSITSYNGWLSWCDSINLQRKYL